MSLHSEVLEVEDYTAAMELFQEKGWTDGLPIVPPTEDKVTQFLDYVGLAPTVVLAEIAERGRVITAEKVAINAVMAGCKPEYMPVIVAVMKCFGGAGYEINHLASMSSPWLMTIVNGPVAKQIGLNSGMYCLGPGTRANCSIARAISLVLANCAAAKIGGVQRGQWGNPGRFTYCIAENEDLGWGPPLHVMQGCGPTTSAVSIKEVYLELHELLSIYGTAEEVLSVLAADWPFKGGFTSNKRINLLFIPPTWVEIFQKAGVTKNDVRQYLFDHVRYSVAELKARGAWYRPREGRVYTMPEIEPGDKDHFIYPFKQDDEEYFRYMSLGPAEGNSVLQNDIVPVVAGGDAGNFILVIPGVPDWPIVTRPVTTRG